jgi:hypothetical protein
MEERVSVNFGMIGRNGSIGLGLKTQRTPSRFAVLCGMAVENETANCDFNKQVGLGKNSVGVI